jgi:uncharacterized cofD-like protein
MDIISGAKIVVIGGGTGSFVVLSGLKNYVQNITALVNMADDGGSTGVLRDELGVLPSGDVRQCLVALSRSSKVRELFNYRFTDGSLKGHAFGNLFLTALEKMTGSFSEGVELASEILQIVGKVEPITLDHVSLVLKDGSRIVKGEYKIGHMKFAKPRPTLWLEPTATLNRRALSAIKTADLIVIAPGNLYGSLAPALVVSGLKNALKNSPAKKIYICNLVTKPNQTDGFKVHDFAAEIERLAGAEFLDYVIYNNHPPSQKLLDRYAAENEYAVEIDSEALKNAHYQAKGADLLSKTIWQNKSAADPLANRRTLIRHDPDQLARRIMRILFYD